MEDLQRWLPLLALAMARPMGAMAVLPMFSQASLSSGLLRGVLALLAAIPALPTLAPLLLPLPTPGHDLLGYGVMIAGEVAIGALLGFSAAIPFWALDMAGFALDTLRGASMAGVFNPLLGGQSSPLGALFSQLAVVLFMVLGGFHSLLSALYQSYAQLPPGVPWHTGAQFLPLLKQLWHTLYTLTLGFALPAIVLIVLVDLALGLVNRSVQQLNVFSLSMPIKSLATLLMLIIGLQFGLNDIVGRFDAFDGGLVRMLESRP